MKQGDLQEENATSREEVRSLFTKAKENCTHDNSLDGEDTIELSVRRCGGVVCYSRDLNDLDDIIAFQNLKPSQHQSFDLHRDGNEEGALGVCPASMIGDIALPVL